MGYCVHFEGFIELCKLNPRYPPTSSLLTLKWSDRLLTAMEDGCKRHAKGQVKDGVMFFDRSLLSPAVYARGLPIEPLMKQAMDEVRNCYRTTMVLCQAERYPVDLRIAGRLHDAPPDDKQVRVALGEEDGGFQETIRQRYRELELAGAFDLLVDTSSPRLALAALLHALSIPFALPPPHAPP